MRPRFRFRPIPFIVTVLLVALGILLGNWQTRRAEEKTALQSRLDARRAAPPLVLSAQAVDPAAVEYRRVIVSGEFVPNWPVLLDNRPNEGRSGFVLLMPFKIAQSDGKDSHKYVLVERGWLPRRAEYGSIPPFSTPLGPRRIEGISVLRPARVLQLGAPAPLHPGAIVQNTDPAAVARASGFDFQPIVLEQTGTDIAADAGGGTPLARNWPAPGVDIARHRGYAVQWYGLATMAFLFYLITGFRRASKPAAA
jgi:cytochrome oxidase assembly protein ShyY1